MATAPAGRRTLLPQFAKFALVGASGYVVNLLVFSALVRGLGATYGLAAVVSFVVAATSNYVWNRLWTFRDRRGPVVPQGLRFLAVSSAALLAGLLVLHALVSAGVESVVAQAIAIVVVAPVSFVANHSWAFTADEWPSAVARVALRTRVEPYREILAWWAGSRAIVFGAAIAVQVARWPGDPAWFPSFFREPFAVLGAWDGRWYRIVAERGYIVVPGHQSDTAFFPLFPAAMRALSGLGIPLSAGGILLANAGFLVGVLALYELARHWLPEADARRAAVYATVFPFGFVFSMLYPEGLVFAALALAGLLAARRSYGWAAVAAALATLGRPQAIFVALPIAALVARDWRRLDDRGRGRALTAVVAAPAAQVALSVYHWLGVGDPFAFDTAQRAWGRWTSLDGIWRAFHEIGNAALLEREWIYRDVAFVGVYLACLALALRAGVPRLWVLAGALMVVLPPWTGSFTSEARFGLLALPVYCGLAWLGRRRLVDWSLRLGSAALLAVGTVTILLHWP